VLLVATLGFALLTSCEQGGTARVARSLKADTVFAEDFESGTLAAWADGVDSRRQRVMTDRSFAQSGSHYLDVTYLAGGDGGWLTRFFMPGYDSLYVSYYVRFPTNWRGGTKLIALYGSRRDDQWSALGKAGTCPHGTDFFAALLVTEQTGDPGPTRFYTYYPAMVPEPDGVTCWGRYGDGTETYAPPLTMSLGVWHHVEFWVKLNTPDRSDASQTFWLDGAQRGAWSGFSLRSSAVLRLNSLQLTFNRGLSGGPTAQQLYLDNLVVATARPSP
jgi:polysaccharide lyase-like protein